MTISSGDLSRAVIVFLGFGVAPSPRRDRAMLLEEFGAERSSELEMAVASLLEEVGSIDVDWSTHSLQSAGEMVRAELRARHPELSESAFRALEWDFTYSWR